jgi:hypothetical protein
VVPVAVPVASPAIVNVMIWFAEMQLTVSVIVPVEFAAVTQPCPENEVTPVLVYVVVVLLELVACATDSPAPAAKVYVDADAGVPQATVPVAEKPVTYWPPPHEDPTYEDSTPFEL